MFCFAKLIVMMDNRVTSGNQETAFGTSMLTHYSLLQCNNSSCIGVVMPVAKKTKKPDQTDIHLGPVITERDLAEYLNISAVATQKTGTPSGIDSFRIYESERMKFQLYVDLTFKGADCLLITTRKTARQWRDLHNLVDYIRSLGFPEAPVSIQLLPRESNEKPSEEKGKKRST
jgi:hypothetical protein